jgi:hypothetical protein
MTTTTETNKPDTLEVQDLDQFVALLTGWHSSKVQILQHMADIPVGSEMVTEAGTTTVMDGLFLDGFKAGIGLALMEMGNLPFAAEAEADATTPG